MVPNSLGPAELLLHYGTEEQKNHYLPRLARGEEIPCFGLTGPRGRLGRGLDYRHGHRVPRHVRGPGGHRHPAALLASATSRWRRSRRVIGLAFRLFDPDHLLGDGRGPWASPAP